MMQLLMLNDTLIKHSIHFSLIWHLQKNDSVILCNTGRLHTQLRKLSEHYAVFGEFDGKDRIISKGLWPPRSPDLNPCDFYFGGKLKNCCVRQQLT
jgi:hypothetical protein